MFSTNRSTKKVGFGDKIWVPAIRVRSDTARVHTIQRTTLCFDSTVIQKGGQRRSEDRLQLLCFFFWFRGTGGLSIWDGGGMSFLADETLFLWRSVSTLPVREQVVLYFFFFCVQVWVCGSQYDSFGMLWMTLWEEKGKTMTKSSNCHDGKDTLSWPCFWLPFTKRHPEKTRNVSSAHSA